MSRRMETDADEAGEWRFAAAAARRHDGDADGIVLKRSNADDVTIDTQIAIDHIELVR